MKLSEIGDFMMTKTSSIIPVLFVGGIAISAITVLLLTSIFWVPFIVLMTPVILTAYASVKYTPLGRPVMWIIEKGLDWIFYYGFSRKIIWKFVYGLLGFMYPQGKWQTLNYGYALLNENGHTIELDKKDEDERFQIQLYHHVAKGMTKIQSLNDKTVLEIGSGRGGGLYYVKKYLHAKKCYGIDINSSQVEFCRKHYKDVNDLYFYQGNAENLSNLLPIREEKFDLIINVQSSHHYGNFKKFMTEVEKLLKSGGYFVIADFRANDKIQQWRRELETEAMKIIYEEDITVNIQHSLRLDENRRMKLIKENVTPILRTLITKLTGLTNSRIYQELDTQKTIYMCFLMQKQ